MTIPSIASYTLNNALAPCNERVDWRLEPENAVLLIHDMQQYFVNFFDESSEPMQTVIAHIQQLIMSARENNIPVIYTAQPKNQSPKDRALLTDFWGEGLKESHQSDQIIPTLEPKKSDKIYTKWRYSAFQKSSLDKDLKAQNKHQIVICGIYAHIGVLSTALEGFMRDYQCFVVEDAIADFSVREHQLAREYVASRCGKLIDTQTFTEACRAKAMSDKNTHNSIQRNTEDFVGRLVSHALCTPLDDINEEDNLSDWGLDSMRLMSIIDHLKIEKPNIDFIVLAENPTLKHWRSIYDLA